MSVLRRGSSGTEVETLQTAINEAGYTPALSTDGEFGPLTEAAVRWYQEENGLTVDGIAGSQTNSSLGTTSTGNTTAVDPSKTDYTDDDVTRFNGLPGEPELWEIDGQAYVMYYVPGSEPPIPLLYSVPSEDDLKSFFGDKPVLYDKKMSLAESQAVGAVPFGSTDTIPAEDGEPWAGFLERMDRAKKVQPWLADPDVFAIVSGAWLEDRQVEQWEFEGTDWWQDQNEAQRSWAWMNMRDPMDAQQFTQDNYITVYESFRGVGLDDVDEALVTYMSTQYTQGNWSQQYLEEQLAAITGDETGVPIDSGLSSFLTAEGIEVTDATVGKSNVRDMFDKWLGPAYPPSDQQIADWSAKYRRDPEAAGSSLEEYLRGQRQAMYPGYNDPNLTYEDIAAPWRGFTASIWGQQPDETSDIFQQVVKLNDSTEASKLLRKEGIKQNIGTVRDAALTGLRSQTSDTRRAL